MRWIYGYYGIRRLGCQEQLYPWEAPQDRRRINGQWKFARGYVPGQPNEGLLEQAQGSPARLGDYDDSGWEVCTDPDPADVPRVQFHVVPH